MSALNSELLKAKKRATKIWFLSCDGYDIPFANYLTSFIIDHNFCDELDKLATAHYSKT